MAEDFIPHDGGERPVDPEAKIRLRFRNGQDSVCAWPADWYDWKWSATKEDPADIVAYQVEEFETQ
jgi:hypothetical protein